MSERTIEMSVPISSVVVKTVATMAQAMAIKTTAEKAIAELETPVFTVGEKVKWAGYSNREYIFLGRCGDSFNLTVHYLDERHGIVTKDGPRGWVIQIGDEYGHSSRPLLSELRRS